VLEHLPFVFSLWQYIPDPSVSEDIATYIAFCLALPLLLAALLILILIRGVETNSNSIHKNVVACVFLAELMFFIALKARKMLVQHEVSHGRNCVVAEVLEPTQKELYCVLIKLIDCKNVTGLISFIALVNQYVFQFKDLIRCFVNKFSLLSSSLLLLLLLPLLLLMNLRV
jgi:hypothetical protein